MLTAVFTSRFHFTLPYRNYLRTSVRLARHDLSDLHEHSTTVRIDKPLPVLTQCTSYILNLVIDHFYIELGFYITKILDLNYRMHRSQTWMFCRMINPIVSLNRLLAWRSLRYIVSQKRNILIESQHSGHRNQGVLGLTIKAILRAMARPNHQLFISVI